MKKGSLKPGDPFYEEGRFCLNERLHTLTFDQLLYIVNALIDQNDLVEDKHFTVTEEELYSLLKEEEE